VQTRYGDIWLRDTGPIFSASDRCSLFIFNGWGGKYVLDHDDEVGGFVALESGAEAVRRDAVLEGGALDWDGEGAEWDYPYGFTPMVVFQHNNVGLDFGWSELFPGLSKFREVDDLASKLSDQIRKMVDAP
jgi:hypothetical protein